GRVKEFHDKRLVVMLCRGTRSAINAVRGKQSMAEFAREAIAREVQRRLTEAENKGRKRVGAPQRADKKSPDARPGLRSHSRRNVAAYPQVRPSPRVLAAQGATVRWRRNLFACFLGVRYSPARQAGHFL